MKLFNPESDQEFQERRQLPGPTTAGSVATRAELDASKPTFLELLAAAGTDNPSDFMKDLLGKARSREASAASLKEAVDALPAGSTVGVWSTKESEDLAAELTTRRNNLRDSPIRGITKTKASSASTRDSTVSSFGNGVVGIEINSHEIVFSANDNELRVTLPANPADFALHIALPESPTA